MSDRFPIVDRARTGFRIIAVLAGLCPVGAGAVARGDLEGGGFKLTGAISGGGGGSSAGGPFQISGWVSTGPDSVMSGGSFVLQGGLAPPEIVPEDRPSIRAVFTLDKAVAMTWSAASAGYVLEFSASLGPDAAWTPVNPQPTGATFTSPCQQPARYFRLRKP